MPDVWAAFKVRQERRRQESFTGDCGKDKRRELAVAVSHMFMCDGRLKSQHMHADTL